MTRHTSHRAESVPIKGFAESLEYYFTRDQNEASLKGFRRQERRFSLTQLNQ